MNARLGLWGARMDNSGLGIQTQEFYNNMHPDKTLVIDISVLEQNPERVMRQHPERYPDAIFIDGIPNQNDMREFLSGLNVVFIAESAYNMDFYRMAKEMGVKVANQYNYEFFDWKAWPEFTKPDMFIAPSHWYFDDMEAWCEASDVRHVYAHVPVDRTKIQRRYIQQARKFVHIAGRPAANDRNGTQQFLQAIQLGEGMLKGIVYTQDRDLYNDIKANHPDIDCKFNVSDYTEMYRKGDVLVLPRKYGGNCLPLNEALAAAMPVIMSDLDPQNTLLPTEWLVPAYETDIEFAPRFKIPVFEVKPHELCYKMMWFQSLSEEDMIKHNERANLIADSISWSTLKPLYETIFQDLADS